MSGVQIPDPEAFGLTRFGDMLWARIPLPGEEPGSFDLFREALIADLQPMTPYEVVLADHLIQVEWELREHRRMRDARIRAAMLEAAGELVAQGAADAGPGRRRARAKAEPGGDAQAQLLKNLASGDPARLAEADRTLVALGLSRVALMAMVWQRLAEPIAQHEDMIRDLERRRRDVQRDLEALQRKRPIAQALSR